MKAKLKSILAVALCAVGLAAFAEKPEISAVSEEGFLDLTVAEAAVNDAAAGSFFGWDGITVTLPDNWQGELPDEGDTWRGATNVEPD